MKDNAAKAFAGVYVAGLAWMGAGVAVNFGVAWMFTVIGAVLVTTAIVGLPRR